MVNCKSEVIVVGGGVVGVSTFYELARRGLTPILLEASEGLATVTSFANGGILTPSMPEPWNGPGVGKHLFSSLFDAASPMKVRLASLPAMVPWGLRFLGHSSRKHHQQATSNNFKLAHRSARITQEAVQKHMISCDFACSGAMKVFSSNKAMQATIDSAETLEPLGLGCETLSAEEAISIEPELDAIRGRISCAIYYRGDSVGDAYKYACGLSDVGLKLGGEIRTETRVKSIKTDNGIVVGVETDNGFVAASDVIVAAGNATSSLVRPHGARLHIKPAKGYSVTLAANNWTSKPRTPVIDDSMHAAVTPIGDRVRIAGTAEFAGNNLKLDTRRVQNLHAIFADIYPHLATQVDHTLTSAWTGLRPMSADGLPFIGRAGPQGLWVNAGHGHLGWTMAMGSAEMIGHLIMGETPAIDPFPFRVGR